MSNGGVAILGSASAEGENRAHLAIENALTSPLLNDNDIRGAKWILININSSEGEHEFTMDEVEIIQNYLLSQAGDDTDVILGLGYDNTLGAEIGITLIATGFEHKDPFPKQDKPSGEKKNEKIVMELEMPQPVQKVMPQPQQPTFDFDKHEEKEIVEEKKPAPVVDLFMPTLIEEPLTVEPLSNNTVDKGVEILDEAPVYFEISSVPDQPPILEFDMDQFPTSTQKPEPTADNSTNNNIDLVNKEASTNSSLSSGGYLAKPAHIYVEEQPAMPISNSKEEPLPLQISVQADEPVIEMHLVVKDSQTAAEEQPIEQTQPIMMFPVEDPALQDETEELRRRATERIAKLRNLSFNINAADPNNEFESVPAYLRRNMEMHNQIADVESFYSNYTVKSDENNQGTISGLNTFLEGKKPD
jgi:cell division protein FtsZ